MVAPSLTASAGVATAGGGGSFSGAFGRLAGCASAVTVHLTAVVTASVIVLAVVRFSR